MRGLAALIGGIGFGLGLGLAGMTDANKVIGFLNLAGDWDPSLAVVMAGAMTAYMLAYRFLMGRGRPLFEDRFFLPTRKDISKELVVGSGLFGIGWALGGFCPGPGLTSLANSTPSALVFVGAMVAGMVLHRFTQSGAPVNSHSIQLRRDETAC